MTSRFLPLVAMAALVGCADDMASSPDAGVASFATAQAPVPQTMTLTMTDPLVPGAPVDIDITGAQPGATIFFIRSDGGFGTACPPPLGGECLDIDRGSGFKLTLRLTADGSGNASFSGTLPAGVPPGTLYFQAVSRDGTGAWVGTNPLERLVAVCPEDAGEPNDTLPGIAAPPSPFAATICPGDADYFRFLVPDGDIYQATVSFDDAGDGDLDVDLFEATLGLVDDSAGVTDDETVSWINTTGADGDVSLNPFIFSDLGAPGIEYVVDYAITTAPVCVDDGFEDNDDPLSATPFTPGTTGTYALCDDDYFEFSAFAGDQVTIGFDYDLGEGDIDAEVYDTAGTLLETYDFSFTAPESWDFVPPADGDYIVRMFLDTDAGVTPGNPSYDLSIDVFTPAPCVDDGLEDDDDPLSANPLSSGTPVTAASCDDDYFSIAALAGDTVDVTIDHDSAEGDLDIEVFDSTGALVTTFTSSATPSSGSFIPAADDTYTFRVYLDTDDGPTIGVPTYDFQVDVTTPAPCVDDGFEDDDDPLSAVAFTPGTTVTRALCDDDYHLISGLAGDVLTIDFDYDLGDGDIDAELYDAAGTLLETYDFSFTAPESWDATLPADGDYYIRMYQQTDAGPTLGGNGFYDLTLDLATPAACPVDALEDDDDATTGTVITAPYSATGLGVCDTDVDGGADWFQIDLLAGDTLTANIFFSDADGDVDLYLFDSPVLFADRDTAFLARGFSASDDETVTWTATADGTYYLLVRLFADAGTVTAGGNVYDIDVTVTP